MTEAVPQPATRQTVHDAITERMRTSLGRFTQSRPRQLRDDAVQLADGGWALVSPEDLEAVRRYSWSRHAGTYAKRGGPKPHQMHRFVLSRKLDRDLVSGEVAEHKNGNGLDNRRSNLRLANHTENMRNRRGQSLGVASHIGVSFGHSVNVRYRAYLTVGDAQVHVGSFDTAEEAAWMRDQWAIALHGEFAVLNFEYLLVETQL